MAANETKPTARQAKHKPGMPAAKAIRRDDAAKAADRHNPTDPGQVFRVRPEGDGPGI